MSKLKYGPYSFSAMSTFVQCKRKYKYLKIDKIDTGPKDMTALLKGGAVHDILEKYPQKSTHKLAPKYQHIADKFISSELGRLYLKEDSVREFKFSINNKLEFGSFWDKSSMFRGAMDHIIIIDNKLYIIDWKTGKYKEQKYQDYTQLIYYAVMLFIKYQHVDEITISFVYVEHMLENKLVLQREHFHNHLRDLVTTIKDIETATEFPKTKSKLCDYCEFQTHCNND